MAMVIIRCPRSGRPVFTGIETDAAVFERLPDSESRVLCPACGSEHLWRKTDALLVESSRRTKT
jgi:hypothetical protein